VSKPITKTNSVGRSASAAPAGSKLYAKPAVGFGSKTPAPAAKPASAVKPHAIRPATRPAQAPATPAATAAAAGPATSKVNVVVDVLPPAKKKVPAAGGARKGGIQLSMIKNTYPGSTAPRE
jgi:hypothetical protein